MHAVCAALLALFAARDGLRWVRDGAPTPQALALVQVLRDAARDGLDPADYDAPLWDERLGNLVSSSGQRAFDEALTAAAERYVTDLAAGRVDPKLAGTFLRRQDPGNVRAIVRRLATAADVGARLAALETRLRAYQDTKAALRRYLQLAKEDTGPPLPRLDRTLRPGERWDGKPLLAARLSLLGDLRAPAADGDLYDGPVVDAVRRFQERHGLSPDGNIGPRTIRALRVPLSRRVVQLQLALERLRWLPHRFRQPPIVVNIPEYRLRWDGPGEVLDMKVMVGGAFRHRTPVFRSALRTVVFRPFWNVPRSIERDELIDQFAKDPAAALRLGFETVDGRLRQRPGPRNALGLVKFEMPNPFGVYLHATPARSLFARSRRDLSHGCIRVEDAAALASRVLQWPEGRVAAAMDGEDTLRIAVEHPVPVLVLYSTAVVREDGEVHFFDDVYRLDRLLERALEERSAQHLQTSSIRSPVRSHPSDTAFVLQSLE